MCAQTLLEKSISTANHIRFCEAERLNNIHTAGHSAIVFAAPMALFRGGKASEPA